MVPSTCTVNHSFVIYLYSKVQPPLTFLLFSSPFRPTRSFISYAGFIGVKAVYASNFLATELCNCFSVTPCRGRTPSDAKIGWYKSSDPATSIPPLYVLLRGSALACGVRRLNLVSHRQSKPACDACTCMGNFPVQDFLLELKFPLPLATIERCPSDQDFLFLISYSCALPLTTLDSWRSFMWCYIFPND